MTKHDDRADVLVAFGRWAERHEDEREARRQAAVWIWERLEAAGLDEDTMQVVEEGLREIMARDYDA